MLPLLLRRRTWPSPWPQLRITTCTFCLRVCSNLFLGDPDGSVVVEHDDVIGQKSVKERLKIQRVLLLAKVPNVSMLGRGSTSDHLPAKRSLIKHRSLFVPRDMTSTGP
jgi:hypothetical protein